MAPRTPVRYAVVGLVQGIEDVYVALNDDRVEVRAVCDRDPMRHAFLTGDVRVEDAGHELSNSPVHVGLIQQVREFPAAKSIEFEASYDDLLDRDDIDAVILVTPDLAHEPQTIAALEAGKYVLCTKPMALTLEAAANIADAAQRFPGHYMLGFQMPYTAFARTVLDVIASGALGTIRQIRFDYHRRPWRPSHSHKNGPIDGAIMKESTHWLDLIYRLNGGLPFEAVSGFSGLDLLTEQLDFEDNGALIVQYDGFRALHSFSYFRDSRQLEDFLIVGERGTLRGSFARLRLENDEEERVIDLPGLALPQQFHQGYKEMHDEFLAMVIEGKQPYTDWRCGMENMLTCVASQIAVAEGRTVERSELAEWDWRLRYGAAV